MIKYAPLILGCVVIIKSYAQQPTHFETPATPAFTILNFEPVSVLRPSSPSELRANVLSFFDKDGKFIPNMGIEVSPYWLQSNPTLTKKNYLNPSPIQSIKQTFSMSFATVKDSAAGPERLGAGFKFQPYSGKTSLDERANAALGKQLLLINYAAAVRGFINDALIKTLDETINAIVSLIKKDYGERAAKYYEREFKERAKNYLNTKDDLISFVEDLISTFNDKSVQIDVPRIRTGFLWEIAGAISFPNAKKEGKKEVQKYGLWTTLSYKNQPSEDFLLTFRYLQKSGDTLNTSLDMGLSYVRDFSNFNLSIEGVFRNSSIEFDDINAANEPIRRIERTTTYRLAIIGQYRINPFILFNISLGKNYAQPFKAEGQFFSSAGLNFNLFRPLTVQEK
jgi:hypothetical protein